MSNKASEKEKTENNKNKNESNSTRENNSLKTRNNSNQKSFINSKNLDILQKRRLPHLNRNKNYFNYGINSLNKEKPGDINSYRRINSNKNKFINNDPVIKEKLIMEINQSNNELKSQNDEIKKFHDLYGTIKKENLANQFLLYQIMNKEKNKKKKKEKEIIKEQKKRHNKTEVEKEITLKDQISTNNNNDKNSVSNKEEKKSNSNSNFDTHSFFLTGTNINFDKCNKTNYSKKTKSTNMKKNRTYYKDFYSSNRESSKFRLLQKELDYYIKTIDAHSKKLEKYKENEKISGYLQAQKELNKKNKELDDLLKISSGLQEKVNEHDMVIYFYKLKNENFISLINDTKKRIDIYHKPNYANWEKRLKKLESQKAILENQNKLYKTENERIKDENEKNKKKEENLDEFFEKNKKFLEEKTKNTLEMTNSYSNEQRLKQKIDLKNKKIEKMKKSNKDLDEYMTKT